MAAAPRRRHSLPSALTRHAQHHGRFYFALALGAAVYAAARYFSLSAPEAIASDTFFCVFLIAGWWLVFTQSATDLDKRADIEDEGAFIVTLITLAAVVYTSFVIFTALNQKQHAGPLAMALTLAGAPLGWLTLQTVMAFRYADLYYRRNDAKDYVPPIAFPKSEQPGPWEFVYLAMVVGMTAQVADTNVQTTPMRRAVTLHAVVSFFFNTVLIAMAVNAAVSGGS
jgi:uncharacterized membrane protein